MTRTPPPSPEPPAPDPVDALLRAAGEQFRAGVEPAPVTGPDTAGRRRVWVAVGIAAAVVGLVVAGTTVAQRRPAGTAAAPSAPSTAAPSSAPAGTAASTPRLDPRTRVRSARWAESGSALDVTVATPDGCPVDLVADPEHADPVELALRPRGTPCHREQTSATLRVAVPLRVDPTQASRVSVAGASVEVAPRTAPVTAPGALLQQDVLPAADGVLAAAPPAATTADVWAGWEVATGRLLIGVRGPGCAAVPGAVTATAAGRLQVTVAQPTTGVDQSCNAPQWRFAAFLPPDALDRDANTVVTVTGTAGSGAGGHSVTLPPLRPVLLGTLEGAPSWTGVGAQPTNGTAPAGTTVRWDPLLRQVAVTTVLPNVCEPPGALVEGGTDGPLAVLLRPVADVDVGCSGGLQPVTALVQLPPGGLSASFPVTVLDGSSGTGPEFTVPATDLTLQPSAVQDGDGPNRDQQGRLRLNLLVSPCRPGSRQVVQISDNTVVVEQPSAPEVVVCAAVAKLSSVTVDLAPDTRRDRPLVVYLDGERLVLPPA